MMVKAPSSLGWYDVVKVVAHIFDFKAVKRKGIYFHMRRGNIHIIVRPREDGVEVHFHEDIGRGLHHQVLNESKKLTRFRKELQTALKNWEQLRKPRKTVDSLAEYIAKSSYCLLYEVCPSFREDRYLCTYRFSNRKYCQEYKRLKRRIRGR